MTTPDLLAALKRLHETLTDDDTDTLAWTNAADEVVRLLPELIAVVERGERDAETVRCLREFTQ